MQNHTRHTAPKKAGYRQSPRTNDFHAFHDPDSAARLSTTVAHALADVMGTDVTSTEFSLYDCVDPDALDQLFSPLVDGRPRSSGHVAFNVLGYRVTVYSSGHIVLTPPPHARSPLDRKVLQ